MAEKRRPSRDVQDCPVYPDCPVMERRAEYLTIEPRLRTLEEVVRRNEIILVGEDGRGGIASQFDRLLTIGKTLLYILAGILLLLAPVGGSALLKLLGVS